MTIVFFFIQAHTKIIFYLKILYRFYDCQLTESLNPLLVSREFLSRTWRQKVVEKRSRQHFPLWHEWRSQLTPYTRGKPHFKAGNPYLEYLNVSSACPAHAHDCISRRICWRTIGNGGHQPV